MAWTRPTMELEKAAPASRLPLAMAMRARRSLPFFTARGRLWVIWRMARSAKESLTGLRWRQVAASMAWTRASKPVEAVIRGGRVSVILGSSTATSGSR